MKVKIVTIEQSQVKARSNFDRNQEIETFDVIALIGEVRYLFKMSVDIDVVAKQQIQIINADTQFQETFKFNLELDRTISKLVSKVYNNEPVELPVIVGEFNSAEIEPYPRPVRIST